MPYNIINLTTALAQPDVLGDLHLDPAAQAGIAYPRFVCNAVDHLIAVPSDPSRQADTVTG